MTESPLDEAAIRNIRDNMLQFFSKADNPSIEASVDGVVSVKMDPHFKLTSVTIRDVNLRPEDTARLERALVTAINQAIEAASQRVSARLSLLVSKRNV